MNDNIFTKKIIMTKYILIALSLLSLLATTPIFGQGCSDAGVCTINSFKPTDEDSVKAINNQIKIGVFYGNADHSIFVYGSYLEYNRQFGKRFGVDLKVTSLAQNGNGISEFGVSDIYLNANYQASKNFKLALGMKIPLSNGGKSLNNLPLPMDYQASLGTFDLIFGVGYVIKKLQIVAAIQQPLTQNDNQFFASSYPTDSAINAIQSTNKFIRSGDVLLRVSYPITLSKKLNLTPSVLPIYHLSNDKYTDEFNVEKEITGSQGLTLNGNLYLDYEINAKNSIQINMGMPFIVRESRPDGLTRSFVVNLEYKLKF